MSNDSALTTAVADFDRHAVRKTEDDVVAAVKGGRMELGDIHPVAVAVWIEGLAVGLRIAGGGVQLPGGPT